MERGKERGKCLGIGESGWVRGGGVWVADEGEYRGRLRGIGKRCEMAKG